MNRTIKEATVKRFFYDTHEQLKAHLSDFIAAYNFARRLRTLRGPTKPSSNSGPTTQTDLYSTQSTK
jgi:hypothetical protein